MRLQATDDILALAATAELPSEHPIGRAIVAYARAKGLTLSVPETFEAIAGTGVQATVEGKDIFVGRRHDSDATTVAIVIDDKPEGAIWLADAIKPDAPAAVQSLQKEGLEVWMVTGDHSAGAKLIADRCGITRVRSGVFPGEKAKVVEELQAKGEKVLMVGDGINDAPALAQANVGMAMSTGTDIAIESAGITVSSSAMTSVVQAIHLSRATLRVIRQNLFWAFFYNALAIPLAALGLLTPTWAALAMAFSSVSVLGNALRLRGKKL